VKKKNSNNGRSNGFLFMARLRRTMPPADKVCGEEKATAITAVLSARSGACQQQFRAEADGTAKPLDEKKKKKKKRQQKKKRRPGVIWGQPVHPHPAAKAATLSRQGRGVKKKKQQQRTVERFSFHGPSSPDHAARRQGRGAKKQQQKKRRPPVASTSSGPAAMLGASSEEAMAPEKA